LDVLGLIGSLALALSTHPGTAAVGPDGLFAQYRLLIIAYLVINVFTFLLVRCYDELIRDFSLFSTMKLFGALAISHLLFALFMAVVGDAQPFLLILNLAIYSAAALGLYRLVSLTVYHAFFRLLKADRSSNAKRAIVFGAGSAGKYLVDMLNQDPSKQLRPVAFIDDDPRLERKRVKGLLVVGPRMLIPYAAKKFNAEVIVIAIPFVDNSTIREIFNLCNEANCTVKRFGNMSNLKFDGLSKSTINEVRVEDLLQREVVRLDLESVSGMVKGRTVLVTGGAGSIGSELCRQIMNYKPKLLVIVDFNENGLFDITMELKTKYHEGAFETCLITIRDKDILYAVFDKYRPDVVFHAAAHKHVPVMEGNLREALLNNVIGTSNVVEASIAHGVERFMLISTDKAVNPTNIMGATKRIAELIIRQKNRSGDTRFAAVRFGNVLGSHSSVVPIFQQQLRAGGPLTVTHKDITRYFMTIPEAVQLVLESASIMEGGEIFVLDMGEPIRIYDLATTMIKLSGLEPGKDIKIEVTGLRPGEKLHEELRLPEETVVKTSNDKIYMMRPDGSEADAESDAVLAALFDDIGEKDYAQAYELVRQLVPSLQERKIV
jgi:FlaA1/EpsC-like NDP-sugar epimerase